MNELMISAVEGALRRAALLRPDATVLLALSGGPDSVALLRALCALRQRGGPAVRAAHVEHGLRGESSLADARFCETLCETLRVPFICLPARLSGGMDAPGAETRAREARYALLLAQARACCADALLTAHHLDDQAETVLSHLIRGSGAQGLSGMAEQTRRNGVLILRPLLALPRETLLRALDGAPYRTDESNRSSCCQRNRLRQEVLPLLTRENPRAAEHMAQSAALLALDEACLHAQAEALLRQTLFDRPSFYCLSREPLKAAPTAVAARALRLFYERGAACAAQADGDAAAGERSLSAADTLGLVALLKAPEGAGLNLPHALRALVTARFVHLTRMADGSPPARVRPAPPVAAPSPAAILTQAELAGPQTVVFSGLTFRFSPDDPARPAPDGLRSVTVPAACLTGAQLRLPRPGDVFHPFGAPGGKPLRRYLTDRKLDPPFRPWLPLLCAGGEALWIAGVGASETTRRAPGPAVRIDVDGVLPWAGETPADLGPESNQTQRSVSP